MPGRQYTGATVYRYGFNGKENDNEVKGNGNQQDYGFRIYDPRLGKFLTMDPLSPSFAMLTPYQFASNSPISKIDLDGLEAYWFQISHDKKTGKAHVDKVEVKSSYLDPIMPYSMVLSIDGGEFKYSGSYWNKKEMYEYLQTIEKNPDEFYSWLAIEQEKNRIEHEKDNQEWADLWTQAFTIAWAANVKKGTYTVPSFKNVKDALKEKNYIPVASQTVEIKNKEFLGILNNIEENGNWAKVYEAGYIGKKKVEVHYFVNKKTGTIVDAKIKKQKWSNTNFGKKAKENAISEEKK